MTTPFPRSAIATALGSFALILGTSLGLRRRLLAAGAVRQWPR